MAKKSLDLTTLLPKQYRDKTIEGLFKNLFNRHVSKGDTVPLFGYIGDDELDTGEIAIQEESLERQINQITSMIYAEHATEKKVYSWPDLLQKMILMGVNYETLNHWFKSASYNLVPPIDLDKFCNFNEYFWIGNWVQKAPNLPYWRLGIPSIGYVNDSFARTNPEWSAEYYTIRRPSNMMDTNHDPIAPVPNLDNPNNPQKWSDWSLTNLWVHKQDAIEFVNQYGNSVSFSEVTQANRPIIEYSSMLRLNTYQTAAGLPTEAGNYRTVSKTRSNQPPLFDIYYKDGTHSGYTSSIFYYVEGSQYAVDPSIQRRVATDSNNDFIFEHSLVGESGELLFYKSWNGVEYDFRTIWRIGHDVAPRYVKYDNSGTLINQDKFTNFRNYYWTGISNPNPSYNQASYPEYTVIEPGGSSDWSRYNYWTHVSQLKRSEIQLYVQASRPIIEFNKYLEAELKSGKYFLGQLPEFKMYAYSKNNTSYVLIHDNLGPALNLNDAYLTGKLIVNLNDFSDEIKEAITSTPELMKNTFEYAGNTYLQGLKTGRFIPVQDGNVYGYKVDVISSLSSEKGRAVVSTSENCVPEIVTLTYDLATNLFNVTGSVSGQNSDLVPNSVYVSNTGLTINVSVGTEAFEHGDEIILNVKGYVYVDEKLYVRMNGDYRTVEQADDYLSENVEVIKMEADPRQGDGVWEVPPQLEWNVENETRQQLKQGDLYFHFVSIIENQIGLIGSSTGSNNYRNLSTRNLGLGGSIKQYDGPTALFISMLIQEGITIPAILEFARQSYEGLFNSIHNFIEDTIPQMLTNNEFTPPQDGDLIDPIVVDRFKEYFKTATTTKSVVTAGEMKSVFVDTTSPIEGLVATLPYLGLAPSVRPRKLLDLELNFPVMLHHDGHRTRLAQPDVTLLKTLVMKKFTRSLGQEAAGFVTATEFPKNPYKGQFWFKTSTSQLFYYNVVSEEGELPTTAKIGDYSVDRKTGDIWQYNGTWNKLGFYETNLPWTEVKLELIEQNLMLAIETILWEQCPPVIPRLSNENLMADTDYKVSMASEFERFGVIYGTPDVYSSTYNAANAFTWNYAGVCPHQSWTEVYRGYYGTPRPELQPWIPAGYPSEAMMIDDLSSEGLISIGNRFWTPDLWKNENILEFLRAKYITNGKPGVMSVDLVEGTLLPPYSAYPEGLFKIVPSTASNPFDFEMMGPIETYWRKTLNFMYSQQKTFFKLDPYNYLKSTWGIRHETVGEYVLNTALGRKEAPVDFQLHGEAINPIASMASIEQELKTNQLLSATVINYPDVPSTIKLTCVNRIDDLFAVEIDGKVSAYMKVGQLATVQTKFDGSIAIYIAPKISYYYWGDSFTIDFVTSGTPTITKNFQKYLRVEGLNQLYVQYRRLYSEDASLSINQTLLKDWKVKSGYRFGSLVNTDTLVIKAQDELLDQGTYNILIKENKFYDSAWLNALKIQLVQKGSLLNGSPRIGQGGTPGEDWIFRIDCFNDLRTELSWYRYAPEGRSNDFVALDGRRSMFHWKRRQEPVGVATYQAPFLIRGIQNVVDFLFGYGDYLEAAGWRFNDQNNPTVDSVTGRPIGFQLLVEQFINQQYLGVDAGSVFVVNPFEHKVWFNTPRGFVADVYGPIGIEQETVCTVLDQTQRPISRNEIRVFREDDTTEIIFDRSAYTIHLLVSEYEHIVLFDNYGVDSMLMYDPFLGQRTNKVFLSGEKQPTFTGRLDLGGHFVLGNQMKRNIENSVERILQMYDSNTKSSSTDNERALSLLGFKKKDYFTARGSTEATEFRFWQGMIANKGTNFAVDAYVNSSQFQSAKLDEYWAYKVAEYGDARTIKKAEMRISPQDCSSENTKYLFLESDELNQIKTYKKNAGYNIADLGVTAYDVATFYTAIQSLGYDFVDPTQTVVIRPDDETRWHKYDDLRSTEYLEAAKITEMPLVANSLDKIYIIHDTKGRLVRADCFEIVDMSNPELPTYYEMGEVSDADPYDLEYGFDDHPYDEFKVNINNPDYDPPKFKRLNHHTIQILDDRLLNRPLKVIAYGPAFDRYSPSHLIDYRNNATVRDDVIWWDPARGMHHPQAINEVDFVLPADPARYNQTLLTYRNPSVEKMKPWGEEQVGKIWWNTNYLDYQPYSDTKIVHDVNERLNSWGAVSDASTIEVYEWIRSTMPPAEYISHAESDGDVAIKYTLKRNRTWYQRPVAWKFSPSSTPTNRVFSSYQPSRLWVVINKDEQKGKAILNTGDFSAILSKDCKIAGAVYSSQSKNDSTLLDIFGTVKITSDPYVVVGDSVDYISGAKFSSNPYLSAAVEIDQRVISMRKKNFLGRYVISSEDDGDDFYVRMTHGDSGQTQRVRIRDIPPVKNTRDSYVFDQLGIIIHITSKVDRADLHGSTLQTRVKHVAISMALEHQLYLRSAVDVSVLIPVDIKQVTSTVDNSTALNDGTTRFILDGGLDPSKYGWIGWADPESNPNKSFEPPFNRYEAFCGKWVKLDSRLATLADDVKKRLEDPWIWFDGTNYNSYKYEWSQWKALEDRYTIDHYNPINQEHNAYIMSRFTYSGLSAEDLKSRAVIYVNEVELRPAEWKARTKYNGPVAIGAYPEIPSLDTGDKIKLKLRPQLVSEDDLKFDPEVQDNMFKNVQYKLDYPHVFEERRDQNDRLAHKYYYFWVKNKLAPAKNKHMSVSKVTTLLNHHDGMYEVPQIFKLYNQFDGRPNRYGMLNVKGMGLYVTESDMYKLRITDNGTLRHDDRNMSLKNKHVEWILLRPNQPTKIPKALWDKLTDTMLGRTADGRTLLPFTPLSKYDARNGTNDSFGFDDGQIMTDTNSAIETVKYTIQNTRVVTFSGNDLVPDYISYTDFDMSKLDVYLLPINIRKFMSDLWRNAKPKQINEIFFAVLEDTAAKNLEMPDFFKTSFISLGEIRTVVDSVSDPVTVANEIAPLPGSSS